MMDRDGLKRIESIEQRIYDLYIRTANIPSRPAHRSNPPITVMRGKLNGSIARGSPTSPTTASFSKWEPTSATVGSAWNDSGIDFDIVENGMLSADLSPVASGTWVQVVLIDGQWVLDDADLECP